VAATALGLVADAGLQGAVLAPTDLLARQHAAQEPAEKGEPRDPGGDGGKADEDGEGDPTAHADGQRPESRIQVHAG